MHGTRLWLLGKTFPSHDKILCLAEWLGVEPSVLRYGEGVVKAVREKRKTWDEGIGYSEREVFEAFLRLPRNRVGRREIKGGG